MYKNVNPSSLGVSGRQSELIELTLTYGFRGLDLEANELIKRATLQGVDEAAKYLRSGKVNPGGWTLPVRIGGKDEQFQEDIERLGSLAETAKNVGFTYCTVDIQPASDSLPYHENFELHRERLAKAANVMGPHGIRLGIALQAAPHLREGRTHQFIHQAEELLTLLRSTGSEYIGLAQDTWNWSVGGGGKDQLDELEDRHFVTLVIADVPEDVDISKITVQDRAMPTEASFPEHSRLVRALAERGYEGPITIQPHSKYLSNHTRDQSVEACARALDDIMAAAGLTKSGRLAGAAAEA